MSKAGALPKTESEAGEFPKMEVKPREFPDKEPFDFPKMEAHDFPKMEPHTSPEWKAHNSFYRKKGDKGASGSGSGSGIRFLTSLGSRFSRIKMKILARKRDLMSLLLSYPVDLRIRDDWVSDSTEEPYDERPLRYVEGLLPMEIIRDVEKGKRSWSIFSDDDLIPRAILNLAADLAVHQLIQTLLSISKHQHPHRIKYIRLSTRSAVEKRAVTEKIEAALNDKHQALDIPNSFRGNLTIDASRYPTTAENQFRRHVCELLQLPMIEDDDISWTRRIEEEMSSNRYLVLLVDRDGEETVDPRKLGFHKTQLSGVLVLITIESKTLPEDRDEELIEELMDLQIRTRDHLLPWEVFCHNVGKEVVYSSSAILTTAVRIVEECRGHLLAIVLVAKWLLRNLQDVKHWELALHNILHTNNPSYDIHGRLSTIMINTFLNLIWDAINKAQKHCLLRCLFIPEIRDGKVDYELMNDWISTLFVDAEETEQNLRQLLDNSVLLQFEGLGRRYIRLPEETYKILQSIYILNPLVLNESGQGLTEPLDTDRWHNAFQIALANNKFSELPLSPYCLELKVLMLQGNADLTKIPSSFFVYMPLLRILDLSYTSVRELPRSLFTLEELRELYLKGCECFMKLPPEIGNLQKLEKLDLDETQITHLPKEVQKLTNMQSLTLYFSEYRAKKNMKYSCSTIIPSGVISKLKKLKHLSIGVNPDDERWHENVQVILSEILGLECLQTLRIYIPQLELLKLIPAFIFEADFRFIVGSHMQRIMSSIPPAIDAKFKQSDCSLKFVKGADVPAEIKMLLRHSKALFLDRHITIKNLSEFEMKNLEQLRVCILAECKEMQTIVGGGDSNGNDDVLSHLLLLSVSHMKNLRSIWEGPTPPRSLFGMLQSLSLQSCPKLMALFSLDFLGNLSLLKDLIVKDCPKLSTLISHESSKRNAGTFLPKLRKLSLLHLPQLTSISSGLRIGPRLKEVGFYGCPKLRSLSRNELSSQELTVVKGETKWWEALQDRPSTFDPIFSSIHEEVDVMAQLGIYNDDDIDNGLGGSVGEPASRVKAKVPRPKSRDLLAQLPGETEDPPRPPCNSAASMKTKATKHNPDNAESLEGLDTPANLAILGADEALPTSAQATPKHSRHRPGCPCIVCIQSPSGKGPKHMQTWESDVQRRFRALMSRLKKKQSEREAETKRMKQQQQHPQPLPSPEILLDDDDFLACSNIGDSGTDQIEEGSEISDGDPNQEIDETVRYSRLTWTEGR